MAGYPDYSTYYSTAPVQPEQHAPHYGGPPAGYGAPPPSYAAPSSYSAPLPYGGAPHSYGGNAAYAPPASSDEVRTVFMTGFPADMKERELNNLMRFVPGYEQASQMNWKNGQAQGFALFASAAHARAACGQIQQLVFDDNCVLRCEMARKNMYIKNEDPALKRSRNGAGGHAGTSFLPSSSPAPYRASQPYSGAGGAAADNPPCNTLFVGNLNESVSEAELHAVFGNQPGFRQLKVVRGRNTTAFVEYDSIPSAMAVHDGPQQNAMLASNADRGGIRIQYSRNPFGRKREYAGAQGPPQSAAPAGPHMGVYEPLPYDPSGVQADNHAPGTA